MTTSRRMRTGLVCGSAHLSLQFCFQFLRGSVFSHAANAFRSEAIILPHFEIGRVRRADYVREVSQPFVYTQQGSGAGVALRVRKDNQRHSPVK